MLILSCPKFGEKLQKKGNVIPPLSNIFLWCAPIIFSASYDHSPHRKLKFIPTTRITLPLKVFTEHSRIL